MRNDHHQTSAKRAAEAATHLKAGRVSEARAAYDEAAREEEQALAQIPEDSARTRGILAVSVVALTYKAEAHARAEALACQWLAEKHLPPFAKHQLRELLLGYSHDRDR